MSMKNCNKCCKSKQFDNRYVPSKYLQRFISLNSAVDMLELKLFPNLKEIGESMSMFYTVQDKLMVWDNNITRNDEDIRVVVVGDGVVPRTACLFNYMTRWHTWSIDPTMRNRNYDKVKRLTVIGKRIEDVDLNFNDQITIIILPHSHAPVQKCWDNIKSTRKWLIKMECCTHDKLDLPAYWFKDKYAITQANDIFIWNNYIKDERI